MASVSKKTKSITIDEHLAEEIDRRSEINFSALVNDLVENYLAGDLTSHKTKTALEVQLEHVENEIEEKEKRIQVLKERRDELQQVIEEHDEQRDPTVEKALETLQNLPEDNLDSENDAVLNWSRKTGIPPAKLIEKVKNYDSDKGSA